MKKKQSGVQNISSVGMPMTINLMLWIWLAENKPVLPPKTKISQTYFERADGLTQEFCYTYLFSDETPVTSPLMVPAATVINVHVRPFPEDAQVKTFACMLQDMDTGQLAFFSMYDSHSVQKIPMALPFRPNEVTFGITRESDRSVAIITQPFHIKSCKVTIFAEYTYTYSLQDIQVIIPCDPELDNEGEIS